MPNQDTLSGFRAAALRVGVTGALRTAALGTNVPTDFSGKYDPTIHINRGYLSPDGIAINFDDETNEFIPWQEVNPIRTDMTRAVKSVQLTLWQFTRENAELYFGVPGGDIVVNADGSWYFDEGDAPEFENQQCIIDVVDGDKAMKLILLNAKVSERSGMTIQRGEAIGLQITLTSYPAGAEYAAQPGLERKTARWLFSAGWDGSGASGAVSATADGVAPLRVQTAALLDGAVGEVYGPIELAALGGSAPYTWDVEDGALPPGVTLSGSTISGTPTSDGTYSITLGVKDSDNLSATKPLTLRVIDSAAE
ncbi:Ig domain-containing protein [Corynebacterium lipophiloflavum]|uniref:PKD domain protein n=1 Tax=Corynebacterium lipophiloflavum (strain ATCC 700352 / DSM 44291 / CCUG 37336 / JCM 10383 / DMMZ 1944) TaxID=525263 RepID=C0XU14_CORLD|nr:Ig domain-containing protein [Corynebacterium lipophiloflavum]EEI16276.1 PKD domain protein [Corynebacterium lipophiloflavum DSM 44291]